jgi:hypothetical protein
MSLDAAMLNFKTRFNAMSLRERAMVAVAAFAVIVLLWDQAFMNPQGEAGAPDQIMAGTQEAALNLMKVGHRTIHSRCHAPAGTCRTRSPSRPAQNQPD